MIPKIGYHSCKSENNEIKNRTPINCELQPSTLVFLRITTLIFMFSELQPRKFHMTFDHPK